jgi:hypothetical protein
LVRPAGLIVQSVLTAKTLDQNQHPLSSKYCCVLELVFPTGTPEIRKTSYVSDSITVKVNLFYFIPLIASPDFKTFKGLVSYGLSLNPVLFHKF